MGKVVIVSPLAEASAEVRLLKHHGFTARVATSATADVVLPAARGSLAFILTEGAPAMAKVAGAASKAIKASRRCTVLWVQPPNEAAISSLQLATGTGVSVLCCRSHEEAAEHILACSHATAVQQGDGGACVSGDVERAQHTASDRASQHLAALFGVEDVHMIDFMRAARPLASLARVASEEDWNRLRAETNGLVDADLLFTAIDWLQRDDELQLF